MNRRSLLQKLLVVFTLFLPARLFARKQAQWKHIAITTRDIEEGLGFDGAMKQILQDLTTCVNRVVEEARHSDEPLARIEFAWRRIRVDNREALFARMIAVRGEKSLGDISQPPNGAVRSLTMEQHADARLP